MSGRVPTYNAFVDWFGHGGLALGLDNWSALGSTPPTLADATDQVYHDNRSLMASWAAGTDGFTSRIGRSFTEPDATSYTLSVWLLVPVGAPDVEVAAREGNGGAAIASSVVSAKGVWRRVDLALGAAAGASWVTVHPTTAESGTAYVGWLRLTSPHDDISKDVLWTRTVPNIVYGRDNARDLAETRTGEVGLELFNKHGRYTPDNPASPLRDVLRTNRQVLLTAEFEGKLHTLYVGYIDDYQLDAGLNAQSVYVNCSDLLTRLNGIDVTTAMFPSIRTGAAVRQILSAAGFPFDISQYLQIDSGATVLRWWTAGGISALQALNDIVRAEGPPSFYSVGSNGKLIFKDRLHRQRSSYPVSATTQLTGTPELAGFMLRDSSAADFGWVEVGNRVEARYLNRTVSGEYSTVWSQTGYTTWGGENALTDNRVTIEGDVSGGYYDGQALVQGRLLYVENSGSEENSIESGIEPADADYVLVNGSVTLASRTVSGTRVALTFRDLTTGAGSTSTIRDVSMRAKAVNSEDALVTKEDAVSVAKYGTAKPITLDLGVAAPADAEAIATLVLRKRSLRRPTVTAVLQNMTAADTAMQLAQDLSGLVRVNVPQWHIDADFSIEGIRHILGEGGKNHQTVLYLEQVEPVTLGSAFTFDVEGQGFGQGVFSTGSLNASNVFILGSSTLNGMDLLTY